MTKTGTIKGGLKIQKGSKWWYGRYKIDGKTKQPNLKVEVKGVPPKTGEEHGDVVYEKAKAQAQVVLDNLIAELNANKNAVDSAQEVHRAVTGRKLTIHTLDDMESIWDKIPRRKKQTEDQRNNNVLHLSRFREWCKKNHPQIDKLDHVTYDMAFDFMNSEYISSLANSTWNKHLDTLQTVFSRAGAEAFTDFVKKKRDTIHRIPFSPEELADVLNACMSDKIIYQLAVTASCTAMRKGDCCKLRWEDVNLDEGFIKVTTSKTGKKVDIPLMPILFNLISEQVGNGSQFVFPRLAGQYMGNHQQLTRTFKSILTTIGFDDGRPQKELGFEVSDYCERDLRAKTEQFLLTVPTEGKRTNVRNSLDAYLQCKSMRKAAEVAGISKATLSLYLNEIEGFTGIAFIEGKLRKKAQVAVVPSRGVSTIEREQGVFKASVRDFHAFRTTWITIALLKGMPVDLVKLVTGHATTDVVMENYFNPHRAELKKAMTNALPNMLSDGKTKRMTKEEILKLIQTQTADNWEQVRDTILANA